MSDWMNKVKRMMGLGAPPPSAPAAPGASKATEQAGGFFDPESVKKRQKRMIPGGKIGKLYEALDVKNKKANQ